MQVLLTGSAGFLGQKLYESFSERGHGVLRSDIVPAAGDQPFVQGDLTDDRFTQNLVAGVDAMVIAHMSPRYETSPSAIMSAMAQFKDRIQVVQSERNDRLIVKLKATSMLRVAEIRSGDSHEWGILSVQMNQPSKKRFKWKFWAS